MTFSLFDLAFLGSLTGAAALDPDAAAYITAVEAADTQALEPAVRAAINDFVVGCKADGIWAAIKASCVLAGARTLAGALVPLVGAAPTRFGTEGGWNYNRETGLQGNGTDNYLDSGRNNNADPQDSCHASIYMTVLGSNTQAMLGAGAGDSVGTNQIIHNTNNNAFQSRIRGTAANLTTTSSQRVTGFGGIQRSGSNTASHRSASVTTPIIYASSTPFNENIAIFARGSGGRLFSNARLAFYSIGESLDLALLDARVTALINAFAAAI